MILKSINCKRLLQVAVISLVIPLVLIGCKDKDSDLDPKVFELNVMSYNMRFEKINAPDPIHSWSKRLPGIVKSLSDYQANIIGTQELEGWQHDQLIEKLGDKWSSVGEPRFLANDERSAIFYRNDIYEYVEGETIWLSETPGVRGSKSWGTSLPRILTYGKFKHIHTGVEFYFYNTHLDHKSSEARNKGLELIVTYMESHSDYPAILTGDFNMYLDSNDFSPLTSKSAIYSETFSPFAPKFDVDGKTSHGFNGGTEGKAIDYIFYSIEHFDLIDTQIIYDRYEDRWYLSDHYPVFSKFKLN